MSKSNQGSQARGTIYSGNQGVDSVCTAVRERCRHGIGGSRRGLPTVRRGTGGPSRRTASRGAGACRAIAAYIVRPKDLGDKFEKAR